MFVLDGVVLGLEFGFSYILLTAVSSLVSYKTLESIHAQHKDRDTLSSHYYYYYYLYLLYDILIIHV